MRCSIITSFSVPLGLIGDINAVRLALHSHPSGKKNILASLNTSIKWVPFLKPAPLRLLGTPWISQNECGYRPHMLPHRVCGTPLGTHAGEGAMRIEYWIPWIFSVEARAVMASHALTILFLPRPHQESSLLAWLQVAHAVQCRPEWPRSQDCPQVSGVPSSPSRADHIWGEMGASSLSVYLWVAMAPQGRKDRTGMGREGSAEQHDPRNCFHFRHGIDLMLISCGTPRSLNLHLQQRNV